MVRKLLGMNRNVVFLLILFISNGHHLDIFSSFYSSGTAYISSNLNPSIN